MFPCRICRLWLLTHERCWGEFPALLQKCRNCSSTEGKLLCRAGENKVQTLEGVLTLPYFSPRRIFITHSEGNKQIKGKRWILFWISASPPALCPWAEWELHPADTLISVSFLTRPRWRGNVNFQLVLVTLVLLQPQHLTRSTPCLGYLWCLTRMNPIREQQENQGFVKIFSPVISVVNSQGEFVCTEHSNSG